MWSLGHHRSKTMLTYYQNLYSILPMGKGITPWWRSNEILYLNLRRNINSNCMDLISCITIYFFSKEAIFSLSAAVGKRFQVDIATSWKTKSSYARVKVEVDLLNDFPKIVNVRIKKRLGEIVAKWLLSNMTIYQSIERIVNYRDNEKECFILHPELYPKEENIKTKEEEKKATSERGRKKE